MIATAAVQKQCLARRVKLCVSFCEMLDFLNLEIMLSVCFWSSKGHQRISSTFNFRLCSTYQKKTCSLYKTHPLGVSFSSSAGSVINSDWLAYYYLLLVHLLSPEVQNSIFCYWWPPQWHTRQPTLRVVGALLWGELALPAETVKLCAQITTCSICLHNLMVNKSNTKLQTTLSKFFSFEDLPPEVSFLSAAQKFLGNRVSDM